MSNIYDTTIFNTKKEVMNYARKKNNNDTGESRS